jgi:hypothetical protein
MLSMSPWKQFSKLSKIMKINLFLISTVTIVSLSGFASAATFSTATSTPTTKMWASSNSTTTETMVASSSASTNHYSNPQPVTQSTRVFSSSAPATHATAVFQTTTTAAPSNNSVFSVRAVDTAGFPVSIGVIVSIRKTDNILTSFPGNTLGTGNGFSTFPNNGFYTSGKWRAEVRTVLPPRTIAIDDTCIKNGNVKDVVNESAYGAPTDGYVHAIDLPNAWITCTITVLKVQTRNSLGK